MRLYLDDNRADQRLQALLTRAGHDVQSPADAGLRGASDVRHLEYAIRCHRLLLTNDSDDFWELDQLILTAGGRHPGILLIRFERDSRKAMKPRHIVAALQRLETSGMATENQVIALNHWR